MVGVGEVTPEGHIRLEDDTKLGMHIFATCGIVRIAMSAVEEAKKHGWQICGSDDTGVMVRKPASPDALLGSDAITKPIPVPVTLQAPPKDDDDLIFAFTLFSSTPYARQWMKSHLGGDPLAADMLGWGYHEVVKQYNLAKAQGKPFELGGIGQKV